MTNIADVVRLLKTERDRLTNQLHGISAALSAFGTAYGKQNGARGKLSTAARARISAAQRQRWAKVKSGQATSVAPAPKKRRTMSPAARKKIAAAQRERWAKVKASHKKG
jgi:hypothetical protein